MISLLYVDDEPELLEIARLFLERTGNITVDTAESASVALEKISKTAYDAIVSDYMMPGMDGIEFLETLRNAGNSIPFIIFTGKGREEVVIRAFERGADFYIQKGGDPKSQFAELERKITSAVELSRAENERKESERRLEEIIDFLPDPTFAIDVDGSVIAWNRAIEEMTGVSACEMLGKGNYEYAIPFYGERRPILIDLIFAPDEVIAKNYAQLFHEKDVLIAETPLPRPGGKAAILLGKASPLYNRQGVIVGAIESVRDVTEKVRAEQELVHAKKDWETMFRAIGHPAMVLDPNNQILDVNDATLRITGLPLDELKGKRCNEVFHGPGSGISPETCPFEQLKRTGTIEATEMEIEALGGYYQVGCTPVYDRNGRLEKVIHIAMDVTARRHTQDELAAAYEQLAASEERLQAQFEALRKSEILVRESEERYRAVVEDQTEFISRFLPDGTHVFVNDAYCRYFGFLRNEILGHRFKPEIPVEDRDRLHRLFQSLSPDHPVDIIEHRILMPDGNIRWQRWSDRAIFDDAGSIIEYQSVGRDITGQKEALEALRVQHNLALELSASHTLKEAFEHILDAAMQVDGLDSGGVYVIDPVSGAADIVAHRGLSAEFVGRTSHFEADTPQVERSRAGTPFYGRYSDIRPLDKDAVRDREGLTAAASIPVLHEGHLIAILNMASHVYEDILPHSRTLLEMLATQVGGALSSIRSEDALRESESKYRTVFENTGTAMVVLEEDGTISLANEEFTRLCGFPKQDIEGKNRWTEFVVKEDLEWMLAQHRLRRENREEALTSYEFRFLTRSGDIRNIFLTIDIIPGTKQSVASLLDITEHKRAEQAVLESEAQLHAILQGSPIPKFVIDRDHRVISWNRALEESSGIKARDILGTTDHWRAFYPDERPCLVDLLIDGAIEKLFETYGQNVKKSVVAEGGYEVTDFFPHLGDSGKWLSIVAAPVLDANGMVIGGVETLEDITPIKEAEQSLRKSEQRYYNIIEDQTEFICRFLPDGTHVFVNEAYARYFGKRRDEMIGQVFRPNLYHADREKVRKFFASLTPEHPVDFIEQRIVMPDGGIRWQRWSDRAIYDERGVLSEYQSVGRDVTAQKQADEALHQANRQLKILNSVTRHDILNKVTILRGYLFLAQEKTGDPVIAEYLKNLESVTKDIQDQIEFTRIYQDLGGHEPQWQELAEVVAHQKFPDTISWSIDGEPIGVFADPIFEKVFSNLLDNSIRHGQHVTTIRVSARESDEGLTIGWEDNGAGIPPDEKERIFERGYGKNTGLGLFLAKEILAITGMTVTESGEFGRGARFEIAVPKGIYKIDRA